MRDLFDELREATLGRSADEIELVAVDTRHVREPDLHPNGEGRREELQVAVRAFDSTAKSVEAPQNVRDRARAFEMLPKSSLDDGADSSAGPCAVNRELLGDRRVDVGVKAHEAPANERAHGFFPPPVSGLVTSRTAEPLVGDARREQRNATLVLRALLDYWLPEIDNEASISVSYKEESERAQSDILKCTCRSRDEFSTNTIHSGAAAPFALPRTDSQN